MLGIPAKKMNDIFISYAAEDRIRVQKLAEALENLGYTIWWDRNIPIGQQFDQVIQNELNNSKAVIVVWTHNALASRWVRSEAGMALDENKALPVMLDDVKLPLSFRLIQTADLTDWQGERDHRGFSRLVKQLNTLLQIPLPSHTNPPTLIYKILGYAVLMVIIIIIGLTALLRIPETMIRMEIEATDLRFQSTDHQDLFGLLTLPEFKIAGVKLLQIPRSQTSPTTNFDSSAPEGLIVAVQDTKFSPSIAAVSLESLPLKDGAKVRFSVMPDKTGLTVSLEKGPFDFQVNLQGEVNFSLFQASPGRLTFPAPRPLRITTVTNGVTIYLSPKNNGQSLIPAPLSIRELAFYQYEERYSGPEIKGYKKPTVISGNLIVQGSLTADRSLDKHSDIRLRLKKGRIDSIRFLDDRLQIIFHGTVRKLELCQQHCDNLMPTYLENFLSHIF